jgi:hypothetical protein
LKRQNKIIEYSKNRFYQTTMYAHLRTLLAVSGCLCNFTSLDSLLANETRSLHPTETTLLWESRYVDSGRQDLAEGGLFSSEWVWAHDALSWGLWMGVADSEDYQEYNLFADYSFRIGHLEFALAYTHLEFQPDDTDDDELSLTAEYEHRSGWVTAMASVYSFETEGSFLELSLARPLTFCEGQVHITPMLVAGIDMGYRTAEHDCLNHIQWMLEAEYALSENWTMLAYAAHSEAREDVKREMLGDLSWAGMGLNVRF